MKKHLLIIFILIPFLSNAQLDITLEYNITPIYTSDGDTLSACRDSMIIFEATVKKLGVPVTDAQYSWIFDDDTPALNDTDIDSVTHIYDKGGGYRVKLYATKGADKGFFIQPIKIAMEPIYTDTKADLPEEQEGICRGSSARLNGKAYPEIWEDEPIKIEEIEDPRNEFSDLDYYSSTLTFDEFPKNSVFSSGNIDSIGISILHADMGDLEIRLSCENSSVVLKNYDASNHSLLGDTALNTPYNYYWSSSSSSGTMNSNTTDAIIPASSYLPDGNFSVLDGCPLNGDWTIDITDNQELDSGFVYSWKIIFEEDVLPDIWTFRDTLVQYKEINSIIYGTYWEGINIGATSVLIQSDTIFANTIASPDVYDSNGYNFHVITNWGCPQETPIKLKVEKISFTAKENPVYAIIDSVLFTNETTWAHECEWRFGDVSLPELILDSDTIIHKYLIAGKYKSILIATDDQGCFEIDTIEIEVLVEPSKIDYIPNAFSPNDDEDNNVYKFSKDKLQGMKEFQITIYNRWGIQVFEANNMEEAIEGWDGKNALGFRAAPGIYFYVIRALGKDKVIYEGNRGNKEPGLESTTPVISAEMKGTIHLFRN